MSHTAPSVWQLALHDPQNWTTIEPCSVTAADGLQIQLGRMTAPSSKCAAAAESSSADSVRNGPPQLAMSLAPLPVHGNGVPSCVLPWKCSSTSGNCWAAAGNEHSA